MSNEREAARRLFIETVLSEANAANQREVRQEDVENVDVDLFAVLCDFFSRTVVFPGAFDPEDGQTHTSDPSRALSWRLLTRLTREGYDVRGSR